MQSPLRLTVALALTLVSGFGLNACFVRSNPGYVQTGYQQPYYARPAPVVYAQPAPVVYAQPQPVYVQQPTATVYVR